ncbi:hypothetical protein ACOKM5_12635 [Streptomyces sp. BH097]|uniref:hypothetical protein n=1 Tax=unclassified Streptomyces TaxID=2593676 RepID=UPI003BB79C3C
MVADAPSGGGLSGTGSGKGWDTHFNQHDLDKLKQMVADAKPQTVKEVAQNWTEVHEHLVGSDGSGGLKQQFDNAVKKVLEKWKGSSADKFKQEADKISQEMAKGGNFAQLAGKAMDNSADNLYKIQDQVQSIDVSWWDEAWDTATDMFTNMSAKDFAMMLANPATQLYTEYQLYQSVRSSGSSIDADLASGMDTQAVMDKWGDKMGAKRQAALQAATHMEQLGNVYKTNAQQLNGDDTRYKPPEVPNKPDIKGPGDMNVPGAGGTNPGISGGTGIGGGGAGQGIPGFDANGLKPPTTSGAAPSQIGTDLDSAAPGLTGGPGSATGAGSGLGAGGGIGGGAGAGGAGLGGGMAGGMAGGLAGGAAGLARGAGGGAAGRSGMAGRGTGAGAGRGTGAGRGMGGMGGGAHGAGGAGKGGLGGKTGAGARLKGGVVGGAKGKTGGAFTPGGSGLRNRGAGAGGAGAAGKGQNGRNGFGPAGAAGGRGAGKGRGEGGNNSRLPDYLVEDESTWKPKDRKANPPVIE